MLVEFLLFLGCWAVLHWVLIGMDVPGPCRKYQIYLYIKLGISDFSSVREVNLGFLFLGDLGVVLFPKPKILVSFIGVFPCDKAERFPSLSFTQVCSFCDSCTGFKPLNLNFHFTASVHQGHCSSRL